MKSKELVVLALLTAILVLCQVGLAFLPNIELVSILLIVYTMIYRKKVFFIIYTFAFIEGIIFGFGIWWFTYLYVWSILAIIILCIKKESSTAKITIISGVFGLSFGFLCSIPYFIVGKWSLGISYFIAGIPFDIAHCIGNVVTALLLYRVLHRLISRLQKSLME